jgi:hypothetical protein
MSAPIKRYANGVSINPRLAACPEYRHRNQSMVPLPCRHILNPILLFVTERSDRAGIVEVTAERRSTQ